MADADYEQDVTLWCNRSCPDVGGGCTRKRGHDGEHVDHDYWGHGWRYRWHDGDTVSVKAGQAMKPAATVPVVNGLVSNSLCGHKSPHLSWGRYLCTMIAGHSSAHLHDSGFEWNDRGWVYMPHEDNDANNTESPATPQPSRRELAESLLKTMVEWDMRSCTVKQQREFLDAIRMLKKEAKQ